MTVTTQFRELPTPSGLTQRLDRFVLGRARAKRDLAVAAYNHYRSEAYRDSWNCFEADNAVPPELLHRLANELLERQATVWDLFEAFLHSDTRDLQANLHDLDYMMAKHRAARLSERGRAAGKAARLPLGSGEQAPARLRPRRRALLP